MERFGLLQLWICGLCDYWTYVVGLDSRIVEPDSSGSLGSQATCLGSRWLQKLAFYWTVTNDSSHGVRSVVKYATGNGCRKALHFTGGTCL